MPRVRPLASVLAGLVALGGCIRDNELYDGAVVSGSASSSSFTSSDSDVDPSSAPSDGSSPTSTASSSSGTGTDATDTTIDPVTTTLETTEGDTDTDTDATVAPPTLCDLPMGAWTLAAPTALTPINSSDLDAEPHLRDGGLTLFFASNRPGGLGEADSYRATRADLNVPFTAAVNNDDLGLNSSASDTKVVFAEDGLEVFLASGRAPSVGGSDLWRATRTDLSAPFTNFENTALSTASDEYDPFLSPDGLRLYYASSIDGDLDLFVAARPTLADPFTAGTLIVELATDGTDSHPALSDDERVILFESNRPGGAGDSDIWIATRPSIDAPFVDPTPLPVINTDAFEGEPLLSADGCELLFASSRAEGLGSWDLWRADVIPAP